ncbi:MAG TPA: hypothetical protein VJ753_01270 [Rhizomicrobium sp.]|nr:hypothetical protein [Rhizomicrobium sp.]
MQGIFHLARHVAFIALVARALLPAGWMPAAQGIAICSVETSASKHQKPPAEKNIHHDICPFAAAPHLASVPDLPQLTLPAFHAFAATIDKHYAVALAARFSPGSPRAPPRNA